MNVQGWVRFFGLVTLLAVVLAYGSVESRSAANVDCDHDRVNTDPKCYAAAWWWRGPL